MTSPKLIARSLAASSWFSGGGRTDGAPDGPTLSNRGRWWWVADLERCRRLDFREVWWKNQSMASTFTDLRRVFWKLEFLFQSHFPFLRVQFNFLLQNTMWEMGCEHSKFLFPNSDFQFLISYFSFPNSDFPFLTSHFSFPISRVPLFHFNFLILHVSMSPLHNPSCLCLTQVFLAKTVIKHLWIIWALISQLVTWSGKQEMGNGKWEMGN